MKLSWASWIRTSEMQGSKPCALPLGDGPTDAPAALSSRQKNSPNEILTQSARIVKQLCRKGLTFQTCGAGCLLHSYLRLSYPVCTAAHTSVFRISILRPYDDRGLSGSCVIGIYQIKSRLEFRAAYRLIPYL